ncbi:MULTISPECIES: hypothetical protein [Vagococcus]|uniref:Uncharacterized protein n=1 Tax=Vagococcus fluvialis bH819 TaxID=1255619 RepID=A0A1X6WS78_9ENTE|nr:MULTISPECIES: hypothetical protein [Vagococcus]SLM87203.1 hypothetical protein FM121_13975 [Vagococcus fluvialis bH819]
MSEEVWVLAQIKQLSETARTYEERAYYQELNKIMKEQYKRIEQAKSELDGNLWSPKKW